MSDLSKPNHFFHGSLGDPASCTGDHNHPEPGADELIERRGRGLPAAVVEVAKQAFCARCKTQIAAQKAVQGTVFVNFLVPALGNRGRAVLCSPCGLAFREFMKPELLDDEQFQSAKTILLAEYL